MKFLLVPVREQGWLSVKVWESRSTGAPLPCDGYNMRTFAQCESPGTLLACRAADDEQYRAPPPSLFTARSIVMPTSRPNPCMCASSEWSYPLEAPGYAELSGGLLLVRPRILGSKSSGLLETAEPRRQAIDFERPEVDTDAFEIGLPDGFVADDLPAPVNAEFDFASYCSEAVVLGRTLRYARRFEIKQPNMPIGRAAELKSLHRIIFEDERPLAVLAPSGS